MNTAELKLKILADLAAQGVQPSQQIDMAKERFDWITKDAPPVNLAAIIEKARIGIIERNERLASEAEEAKPQPQDPISFLKAVLPYFNEEGAKADGHGYTNFEWRGSMYKYDPNSQDIAFRHSKTILGSNDASILMTALVKLAAGKVDPVNIEPDPKVYVKIEDVKAMFSKMPIITHH